MLSVNEEVDAFLRFVEQDSYGDDDNSTLTKDVISHMLNDISSCKEQDDISISNIEELIKTNPSSCLPKHVLQLAKHRRWNSVLKLVDTLLTHPVSDLSKTFQEILHLNGVEDGFSNSSGNSSDEGRQNTCMLIFYKILALQKIKRYGDLRKYLQMFYPNPSKDYSFTSMNTPHWVPLSLKCYIFCLLYYSPDTSQDGDCKALENSTNEDFCKQLVPFTDTRSTHHLWILADFFTRQNEFRLALKFLDSVLITLNDCYSYQCQQLFQKKTGQLSQEMDDFVDKFQLLSLLASRIEVFSCQGRILAECGALDCSETLLIQAKENYESMCHLFPLAKYHQNDGDNEESLEDVYFVKHLRTRASYVVVFDTALLLFSRGMYNAAQDEFLKALTMLLVLYENPLADSWLRSFLWTDETGEANIVLHNHLLSYESVPDLIASCCVNISLCAFYLGRMRVAIHALESVMRQHPTLFMTEYCIFNVCTLYELGYDPVYSEKKKSILWEVVKNLQLDDLADRETFRLS